jgi:hypothetical protein
VTPQIFPLAHNQRVGHSGGVREALNPHQCNATRGASSRWRPFSFGPHKGVEATQARGDIHRRRFLRQSRDGLSLSLSFDISKTEPGQGQVGWFRRSKLQRVTLLMLTRKSTVSRRARYAVRLPDHSRPHGRRRGYDHARPDFDGSERKERGPSFLGFVVIAAVLSFLMLIVAGVLAPKGGPLIKQEPVSTERVR